MEILRGVVNGSEQAARASRTTRRGMKVSISRVEMNSSEPELFGHCQVVFPSKTGVVR